MSSAEERAAEAQAELDMLRLRVREIAKRARLEADDPQRVEVELAAELHRVADDLEGAARTLAEAEAELFGDLSEPASCADTGDVIRAGATRCASCYLEGLRRPCVRA